MTTTMTANGHHRPTGFARPLRVLGIGGSTRQGSKSLIVLETALRLAEDAGAEAVLADVRALDLPVYDPDRPRLAYPPILDWLLDETMRADGYLICSPTYHGTVAGGVKNVLDTLNWLGDADPPYFGGKPVGLLALGGASAMNVINALYHATRAMNGLAMPTLVVVPYGAIDTAARDVTDDAVRQRLAALSGETVDLASRLRRPMPVPAEPWDAGAIVNP